MTLRRKKTLKIVSLLLALCLILFVVVTYVSYRDLKKELLAKISEKTSLLFGQRVTIGDASFRPWGEMSLRDIVIRNPAGVEPGRLLGIKRLSLDLRWRDLAKGEFSFRSIEIFSPELTLLTGEKGILNVSDELKRFLSTKGTAGYRIGELRIRSGTVLLNDQIFTTGSKIDLTLKGLSSYEEDKTLLNGTLSYLGNSIRVEGWAYLNSAGRNFSVLVSSEDFVLSSLKKTLGKYGLHTERMKVSIKVDVEGDTVKGCKIISHMKAKGTKYFSFYRERSDIRLEGDAFYNIRESSLAVNDLSLYEGNVPSMNLKGMVMGIGKELSYAADVRIAKMDLSRLNSLMGLEISGEVTSDVVRIRGKGRDIMPEISGSIRLRAGTVRSSGIQVEKADADLKFSVGEEMSLDGMLSARMSHLQDYLTDMPVDATVSMKAHGKPERMELISSIHFSPLSLKMREGKNIVFGGIDSSLEGTLSLSGSFTGKGLAEIKGITYGEYAVPRIVASLNIDCRKNTAVMKDLRIDTRDARTSVSSMEVQRDEKRSELTVQIKGMTVLYPAKELEVKNADGVLHLRTGKKTVRGEAVAVSGEVTFQGIRAGLKSGSLEFDEHEISLSIPDAEIAGGRATLHARGKASTEPFPVKAEFSAEGIDLAILSKASPLETLPYSLSGNIKKIVYNGSIESLTLIQGKALMEARGLSVLKKGNKAIVKDGAMSAEITFAGKDWSFVSEIVAGNAHSTVSGKGRGFAEAERKITAKISLPETKMEDIRNSFWDVFPDRLLYAGLRGTVSSAVAMEYSGGAVKMTGDISLRDVLIQGEEGEYSVGPIDGSIPLRYETAKEIHAIELPSFERSEFQDLSRHYSREPSGDGHRRITIGSLRYGFRIVDAIEIRLKEEVNRLNIVRLGANIFGGRLYGSAVIDFSKGLTFRAGLLLEGLSLARLCEEIEPVRGYLSGKVDGLATLKGSGEGMSGLLGKADFWTYSSGDEKTKVSREFLQKIGGPSLKAYLGDRSYDKGVMGIYLQNGYVIFRELEISHKNMMGATDLSVKVAPYNNRIEIDHLLWTITEAAQRAGKSNSEVRGQNKDKGGTE